MSEIYQEIDKNTAKEAIMATRQEIYMMGANDAEFDLINEVLEKLESGELQPEAAMAAAETIKAAKQDYH